MANSSSTRKHATWNHDSITTLSFGSAWLREVHMEKKVLTQGVELGGSGGLNLPSSFFSLWGLEPPSYSKQKLIPSNKWQGYEILVHVPRIINITMTLFLKRSSYNGFLNAQLCHNIKSSFQRSYYSTFFRVENCVKPSSTNRPNRSICRAIESLWRAIIPCQSRISVHFLA